MMAHLNGAGGRFSIDSQYIEAHLAGLCQQVRHSPRGQDGVVELAFASKVGGTGRALQMETPRTRSDPTRHSLLPTKD